MALEELPSALLPVDHGHAHHHVEAGGKASPLVKHNKAKSEPKTEPEPVKPARKTILRKKS